MKTTNMKVQSHYSPGEAIVNISKRQVTTLEKSVLNKGPNFATTIKRISYLDLIGPIKDAALKIPKARANELRWKFGNKLADLIGNGGYCKVKKDPALKTERKLS